METPLGQVLSAQPGFDRYGNAYEANLGASWELDIFGGLRRRREVAQADYQASEAGAAAARLAALLQSPLGFGSGKQPTRLERRNQRARQFLRSALSVSLFVCALFFLLDALLALAAVPTAIDVLPMSCAAVLTSPAGPGC